MAHSLKLLTGINSPKLVHTTIVDGIRMEGTRTIIDFIFLTAFYSITTNT
jgi:hypothetical protein